MSSSWELNHWDTSLTDHFWIFCTSTDEVEEVVYDLLTEEVDWIGAEPLDIKTRLGVGEVDLEEVGEGVGNTLARETEGLELGLDIVGDWVATGVVGFAWEEVDVGIERDKIEEREDVIDEGSAWVLKDKEEDIKG